MRQPMLLLKFFIFAGISQSMIAPAWGSPSQSGYKAITVKNFVIDAPSLAETKSRVDIVGFYIMQGSVGMLYANMQDVIMTRYHPDAGTQPSVALRTDKASHQLREALVSCDSNPSSAQIGCQIEVRGHADSCTLTNMFGATRVVPCLVVEEGNYWSPPPPSPEQLQAAREAREAEAQHQAEQARIAEQARQVSYQRCLQNFPNYARDPNRVGITVCLSANPPPTTPSN